MMRSIVSARSSSSLCALATATRAFAAGSPSLQPIASSSTSGKFRNGLTARNIHYLPKKDSAAVTGSGSFLATQIRPFSDIDQSTISANNLNVNNDSTMPSSLGSSNASNDLSSRTKLRVADVLKGIDNSKVFTISQEATISDAVAHLVQQKISATLVIDRKDGSIVGIFTARDLLKCICEYQNHHHPSAPATASSSFSDPESHVTFSKQAVEYINKTKITEIMTPRDRLVYCSPNDSLSRCREIMFQCKIRNLPIIDSSNTVKGILTMKIIADSSFNLMEIGGKKGFIHNVTGRRGLPNSAKVDMTEEEAKTAAKAGSSVPGQLKLDMELGLFALPHPFKSEKGVSNNRRDYGAYELSTDLQYCEDAFFAIRLKEVNQNNPLDVLATPDQAAADPNQFHLPLSVVSEPSQVYFCVADGVGSWRQYGIDPRDYSHRLVENAKKVIESDHAHRALVGPSPFDRELPNIHPLDVILDAWNLTLSEGVQGSSTICVATLDKKLNQLSYSNIGDCGLMVVRHIDSETAGYMRDRSLPRHLRKTDLKIAYISQQQLRSFNLPYQLGYSKFAEAETTQAFETPTDADTASIPVMPGDLIVLATDGLFDNLDLEEIVEEIYKWEQEFFSAPSVAEDLRLPSKKKGNYAVQQLAERLVKKARELSLDNQRDSPFAILAKENDIMWGGGMPDDTTVIVGRVVAV